MILTICKHKWQFLVQLVTRTAALDFQTKSQRGNSIGSEQLQTRLLKRNEFTITDFTVHRKFRVTD